PDHLPAVSFLKAPGYQDGHAAYSDPIDEQQFVVNEINNLQHTPDWSSTAVVIAYDDSDGFYDHVFSGVQNPSNTANVVTPTPPDGTGRGAAATRKARLDGQTGRGGLGPGQPLLVSSPWAKHNVVDNTVTDLSSVVRFAEDNWHLPRIAGSSDALAGPLNKMFNFNSSHGNNARLFLDPVPGQPSGS